MEFDTTKTVIATAIIYALFAGAFLTSPMPIYAMSIVLGVLLVYGALIFGIGMKYGEYRATQIVS